MRHAQFGRVCCIMILRSRWAESYFFFFQAEDGIRDKLVTGVQTCALPIYRLGYVMANAGIDQSNVAPDGGRVLLLPRDPDRRSEERRVGKEGRSRWSPYH